ncbi:MAG: DnaD domain protein [Clostridia bacterium]|nr:DnaD domain protein [Clostridia bacterium]
MIKFVKPDMVTVSRAAINKLLAAPEGCIKIYLYGTINETAELSKIMTDLAMDKKDFLDCLEYLQKNGFINIDVTDNTTFTYTAVEPTAKNTGPVYPDAQFNSLLQSLFTDRELGFRELKAFYECTEVFGLPKKVVLMLAEHCIATHRRGNRLPASYITEKAKEWAKAGIDTIDAAERIMHRESKTTREAKEILELMGINNRYPSEAEEQLYEKWTNEWGFDISAIRSAMLELTKINNPNMKYLDTILSRLYQDNRIRQKQIEEHFKGNAETDAAIKSMLGVLGQSRQTVTDDMRSAYKYYIENGIDAETILYVAKLVCDEGGHTFQALKSRLDGYIDAGLTDLKGISSYEQNKQNTEMAAKALLEKLGIVKNRLSKTDIDNYLRIKDAGLQQDVVLYAAQIASQYQNPLRALMSIIKRWKAEGVQSVEDATRADRQFYNNGLKGKKAAEEYIQRNYTSEQFDERMKKSVASLEDSINDDFPDI